MGTKRTVDSGRKDKLNRRIMESPDSGANNKANSDVSAQGDYVTIKSEVNKPEPMSTEDAAWELTDMDILDDIKGSVEFMENDDSDEFEVAHTSGNNVHYFDLPETSTAEEIRDKINDTVRNVESDTIIDLEDRVEHFYMGHGTVGERGTRVDPAELTMEVNLPAWAIHKLRDHYKK